jgi:hypothetical protein
MEINCRVPGDVGARRFRPDILRTGGAPRSMETCCHRRPHPRHEWRRDAPLAPWRNGGWLATKEGDRFRPRPWRSPASGNQLCDSPGTSGGTRLGRCPCGGTTVAPQRRRSPPAARPIAGATDSNPHDVMSARQAESAAMSCRKELSDDLSVRDTRGGGPPRPDPRRSRTRCGQLSRNRGPGPAQSATSTGTPRREARPNGTG